MMLALSMASRGRLDDAAAEVQRAIAEAHPATEPDEITPLHRVLGDVSSQNGEFATAVRAYSEAAVRLDRAGDVAEAVQTRWRMSKAMLAQGATADAVAVLETLTEAELPETEPVAGEPSRNAQLLAQIRADLGLGLLELDEPRAAAVEFLRIADTVGSWPDQSRLTHAAARAAQALALADNWDAARAALKRALDSNITAPCVPDVTDTLRELASAAMRARGAEGFDEAFGYLAQADAIRSGFPEAAREQFVSVEYDVAQTSYVRGKVLLTADRPEEALAAFQTAIAGFDSSGHPMTSDRFEAVRMAAIIELNHLDRAPAAHARLDEAIAEAKQAGHWQAVEILGRLRGGRS
jgi:tetratricopeptide (TPR) repeat protein